MPFLFRSLKFVLKLLLGFVAFIIVYFLCAQGLSAIKVNTQNVSAENTIPIYIKSNGVHTDIVVPATNSIVNWRDTFAVNTFEKVDSTFQYLSFGWGDKGFYLDTPTWDDLKASTAFKALFFMSNTAMHVTYRKKEPQLNEDCVQLLISEEIYKKLCTEISSSFKRADSKIQLIALPGYGDNDNFYEAEGTYSFLKTCNVWTGQCLKNSDICVGFWTPFDWNVLGSVSDNVSKSVNQ
ncbi:MAG: hypothetical protein K0S33_1820 [Bacteroidetes bacterium]|jgi:uncharacterized protein (TIGR02117 family)|nr:hypothetical protein [Bacteroidota bacterium]